MKVWKAMEADPVFQHPVQSPSLDEYRELNVKRTYRIRQLNFLPLEEIINDMRKVQNVFFNI
jgi:hypothetical protein